MDKLKQKLLWAETLKGVAEALTRLGLTDADFEDQDGRVVLGLVWVGSPVNGFEARDRNDATFGGIDYRDGWKSWIDE